MFISYWLFDSFFRVNLLLVVLSLLFSVNNLRNNFFVNQSEIKLVIKGGEGANYFLNNAFYKNPSKVFVNDNQIDSNINPYNFNNGLNNVTIKFDDDITSCKNMFSGLNNIIEIDLSNFDTSKVTDMDSMFYKCTNLEKINFGNINTSLVKNMRYLFHYCYKLSSIDLSNFDTSSVTDIDSIFRYCTSLTSINVSTFNTKNVENMLDIFAYCYVLTSVDLSNFDTSKVTNMRGIFYRCYKIRDIYRS